jgi:hypothetical protein
LGYYQEVEKKFSREFEKLAELYFPYDADKRAQLKAKIAEVDELIAKLDAPLAATLRKSLARYAEHVKHSSHSIFQDFIFPLPIRGLGN